MSDSVAALHAEDGGRWLVTTQGSQHVWDLDARTYQRLPGEGRAQFDYDGEVHPILRVGKYPAVGEQSLVFFDDPHQPSMEQWRICSTIVSIVRLPL